MTPRQAASLLVSLVVVAGCSQQPIDGDRASGKDGTPAASPSAVATAVTATPTPSVSAAYAEVEFATPDGEVRSGRVFGDGRVGVVLSHLCQPGDTQEVWAAFGQALADRGHRVLTYEMRDDHSRVWQDVLGGVAHLRDAGAEVVVLGGACLGAMASLRAASEPDARAQGLFWLAGYRQGHGYSFGERTMSRIACPLLFAVGEDDSDAALDTRELHELAHQSELTVVDSALHGTDILREGGAPASELTDVFGDFVDRVADAPTDC